MKQFSQLFSTLETSNKTNDKISALVHYFSTATEEDKLWLIALFTGKRPKRPVKTNFLKLWAMEISEIPEWLFLESYASVGDLGETIALLLPPSENSIDQSLSVWMKEIIALHDKTDEEKKEFVTHAWNNLDTQERLIFNKLIGGSFRIGVSHKLLVNALSKYSGIDENALMHAIIGKWKVEETQFSELINGENINTDASKLYPFCLAYPLENELEKLGEVKDWQIEYKWDGIRGQIIKRNEEIFIWSRGEELVTEQFPELVENIKKISGNFVLDGEILAIKEGQVLNFNDLQERLNRKNVSKKMMEELTNYLPNKKYAIHWKLDSTKYSYIDFKGYEAGKKPSGISGKPRLFYDRNKPFTRKVKFFDTYKSDKEITIPTYYVIPKSEGKIIENLKRNQIKFKELQSDSLITVESYKIVDFKTVKNPYEGHYLHFDTQVSSELKTKKFSK